MSALNHLLIHEWLQQWDNIGIYYKDGLMDDHWRPIYSMCSVCEKNLQYDIIIKFENLEKEEG
jgi:hypothetical protein